MASMILTLTIKCVVTLIGSAGNRHSYENKITLIVDGFIGLANRLRSVPWDSTNIYCYKEKMLQL